MIIPVRLTYLFTSTNQPSSPMKTPSFEEQPSFFYASFINLVHTPLLEKEEELLLLYEYVRTPEEAQSRLDELTFDLNALPEVPKHSHSDFKPIYDAHDLAKASLLSLIAESKKSENFSSATSFNADNLRPFYEDYLRHKDHLYQVTIETFKRDSIVFYLEEDGSISVYDP